MEKEILDCYKNAGIISKEVIEFSKPLIKEGEKLLIVAEKIEKKNKRAGWQAGFPT